MERPPKKSTARELVEHVGEAAAGAVPIAGSPLAGSPLAVAFVFAMGLTFFDAAGITRPTLIGGSKAALLAELPAFQAPGDWLGLCFGDLSSASLVVISSLGAMQTGPSLYDSVTSPLGKRFIAFVRDPREGGEQ